MPRQATKRSRSRGSMGVGATGKGKAAVNRAKSAMGSRNPGGFSGTRSYAPDCPLRITKASVVNYYNKMNNSLQSCFCAGVGQDGGTGDIMAASKPPGLPLKRSE